MRTLLLLLLVVSVAGGCRYHMQHGVKGSGVRQSQKRDVPAFTAISSDGAFDIEVDCQKPQSLQIEGDDNILPLVSTEVSNNVLHIKSLSGYSVRDTVALKITIPNLDGLSSNGAGKISVAGIKNDKFEIDSNGAPTIVVSGETKVVNIDTSGAGKIDTRKLRASRAVVDSKGVSKVQVDAREQLDVTISGPSNVVYEGDPVVNKTIHGPGSVVKKESSPT